jgi:predicted small lipoprotein YifL
VKLGSIAKAAGARPVVWLIALFVAAACGIKGPPVAPQRTPPAAVGNLRAVVDGQQIRLSWSVPQAAVDGSSGLSGFYLFRWRSSLDEAACNNCPRTFERVADIDAQNGQAQDGGQLAFSGQDTLQGGYRYAYKVVGYSADGLKSADSNMLNFDY